MKYATQPRTLSLTARRNLDVASTALDDFLTPCGQSCSALPQSLRLAKPLPADPLILAIEDDSAMRRFLRLSLTRNGYRFIEAKTGHEGLQQAAARDPDLILLDLALPDHDGLTVTERLREWASAPIVVLSARGGELDKLSAFDAGVDDYMTKPFRIGELLARIRVALRRATSSRSSGSPFSVGDLTVDFVRRQVRVRNADVHLTPTEYRLLAMLIKNAGRVVTHSQLLNEVWGPHQRDQIHYLRVYMGQLRRKLERDPNRPAHLLTEPGIGYRLRFAE